MGGARDSQPVTVLRIGDYDPSGESMFTVLLEDITAFAGEYSGDVEFAQSRSPPSRRVPAICCQHR
ncbi:MAG: hypothetical protein J2P48_01585 [Alphaproteobacteria bacterium]|nr:hypothetical protein [Alphaproteobacteria bacterium]